MKFKLIKRKAWQEGYQFEIQLFDWVDEAIQAAVADGDDFVVECDEGIVNYRIGGVWKSK